MCGVFEAREHIEWVGLSYLAGRDKLQRAQGALQVGDIVLEVSQRLLHVSNVIGIRDWMRGQLALAMLVSISEGFCLEGLLGAILFSELDMLAADVELVEGCRACRRGKFEEAGSNIELRWIWAVHPGKRGASLSLLHR
jgi:hypothetical protein